VISKLEISGVHMEIDESLEKYINKKIGQLDKYAPRKARSSLHAQVKLKESKAKDKKNCTCEVTIHLPHEVINTQESTINMFAAIDIVETKLKQQLKKYKELHGSPKLYRHLIFRRTKSSKNL
jgi:putative sigma-54 modulation protein